MTEESLYDRVQRKRRASNDNWTEAEEKAWLERHPEDAPSTSIELVHAADLVPDIEINVPLDDGLDPFLGIDIIEAYVKFCGKMVPNPNGRTEGIKISCPDPGHRDTDPSAWISTEKQTWFCGGCQVGGDKYDIYALNRGWTSYKAEFGKIRKAMASELGWVAPIEAFLVPEDLATSKSDQPSEPITTKNPLDYEHSPPLTRDDSATITKLSLVRTPEPEGLEVFRIDWESIIPPETFMWEWMQSTAQADDLPHEYYFWLGIQAIGFAAGNDVYMPDQRPIKANFNICSYGKTGAGKSRANYAFVDLIEGALPWTGDEYTESKGVQILHSPGSSEALLKSFSHEILDPATHELDHLAPVRGLLRVDEFASFIAKAARPGGNMKERLIELYDVFRGDVTHYSLSASKIVARAPFCQMLTTTQPKAIHTFTTRNDVESGFLNRWVFAIGPRRRRRSAHGGATIHLADAINMLRGLKTWCDPGHEMVLVKDALLTWEQFFYAEVEEMIERSEESMFSRLDLILKKLILIFCINEREPLPTPAIIEKVKTLLPYLKHSMGMFSRDISYTEYDECINRVIKAVRNIAEKKDGKPATKRDIHRRLSGSFSDKMILDAIKTASDLGLLGAASATSNKKSSRPIEGFVPPG